MPMSTFDEKRIKKLSDEVKSVTNPKYKPDVKIKYIPPEPTPEVTPMEIASKLNSLEGVLNPTVIDGHKPHAEVVKDVITELKGLKGNDRMDITSIRNGENLAWIANQGFNMNDQRWHGSGGGASLNLQQVTDNGATTTDAITINGLTSNSDVTVNGKLTVTGPIDPTYIEFTQITTPTTPASGKDRLYFKSDNNLYLKNPSGTETQISNAGGSGTVTNVATGTGLTGGAITTTGTISLDSKLSPLDSLTGNSLKFLRVNAGETAVEYATPAGAGTVTSVTSADGNATVATQTSTPVITIVSAPKLQTARTIGGTSFDGTANISIGALNSTNVGATTSAQFAGVISDETGTGVLVFATSPTLVTPALGVATATSINKITVTAPATSGTLTIDNGFTLHASGNATVSGTSSGTNTGDQTITLTSDVTGSGTGSFATTLATVNSNVGSFTSANITVNAKGLVTAASNGTGGATALTLIPKPNFNIASTSGDGLNNQTVNVNTTMFVGQIVVPFTMTANDISYQINPVTTPGTIKIALFSEDGQTKVFEQTTASLSATGLHTTALSSPTTINAGVYYVAIVPVSTTDVGVYCYVEEQNTTGLASGVSGKPVLTGTVTVTAGTVPSTITPGSVSYNSTGTLYLRLDN